MLVSYILVPPESSAQLNSETVLSSRPILSSPSVKSVIMSARFISVVASLIVFINVSTPSPPVSVSLTPLPEPP